jgi:DNA transposition AAA+ family ATPase
MNTTTKGKIKEAMLTRIETTALSQAKAAVQIGISDATISQIKAGNWDNISDALWRKVAKWCGFENSEWVMVETNNFSLLTSTLRDAQNYAEVHGIIADAGTIKSSGSEVFRNNNEQVYYVECAEYWNKKQFLNEILTAMGKDASGLNVSEMMESLTLGLTEQAQPLLILDEYDKLKDDAFIFLITLYNKLEDKCGIVILATDHLKKRIDRGVIRNKKGYKEIYSRLGRKFITLPNTSSVDISKICIGNGISDVSMIESITRSCGNDLRAVRKMVTKIKHSIKQNG